MFLSEPVAKIMPSFPSKTICRMGCYVQNIVNIAKETFQNAKFMCQGDSFYVKYFLSVCNCTTSTTDGVDLVLKSSKMSDGHSIFCEVGCIKMYSSIVS